MTAYPFTPPLNSMRAILSTIGQMEAVLALPPYQGFSGDLVNAILDEAGKFATSELAPLNQSGDREGSHYKDGAVCTPAGFKEAYAHFVAGGWNTVSCPQEFGGQGLPSVVSTAISELWKSANMSFALCPMLSQAGVELLAHHGSEELRAQYLPRMVEGTWTGTMCLTESQAGSDVGALSATAEPDGDGAYRLKGTKIFITYGEHDMAENIIHMVLARLPDAPEGTRGISLFLVPKFIVNEDGALGERNDITCVSIEHKMGINASPTCVMSMGDNGGATGYLLGEAHGGIKAMFTMMNTARLQVGIEGIGIAERAHQLAVAYAAEREQGGRTIDQHADVQQMLSTLDAHASGLRALGIYAALQMDLARYAEDSELRAKAQQRLDLMIPIVKAYGTDTGFAMASLAMQVYGGIGYIEETGVAQLLRDIRISMIYEGTNGIQAMDLMRRKLPMDNGQAIPALMADILRDAEAMATALHAPAAQLTEVAKNLDALIPPLLSLIKKDTEAAFSCAGDFLALMGVVCEGWLLGRIAIADQAASDDVMRFTHHGLRILPRAQAHHAAIMSVLNA